MAEDVTKTMPSPDVKNDDFEKKLDVIEKTINRIDQIKKKQFYVSIFGMVLIILVMAVFVISLVDFVRNYNSQLLLEEISKNSTIITRSPELRAIGKDFQEVFIPEFKKELFASFESSLPKIKEDVFKSAQEIEAFLQTDIRNKVLYRLSNALTKIEKGILAKHPELTSAELEKAFNEVNTHFIEELTNILDKRLGEAKDKLMLLDESFRKYSDTPEYAAVKKLHQGEVENLLLESFLELWIYHLNAQKGAVAAVAIDTKGGK